MDKLNNARLLAVHLWLLEAVKGATKGLLAITAPFVLIYAYPVSAGNQLTVSQSS